MESRRTVVRRSVAVGWLVGGKIRGPLIFIVMLVMNEILLSAFFHHRLEMIDGDQKTGNVGRATDCETHWIRSVLLVTQGFSF
jgi:hypothetical protein